MKGKASDICTKCKHCEGLDMFAKMYSCKHFNRYPDAAIGVDCEVDCCNFEEVTMNKIEGKVSDWCPKCKNCTGTTKESNGVHVWLTEVECEDPYDGMTKTLTADSDICCSMFELKEDKLMQYYREKSKNYEQILTDISRFVPVDVIDFKDLPKIIEQMRKTGDMYDSISESYDTLFDQKYEFQKANEKLEDKYHKLERKLTEEKKRFNQLYNEFLTPLARVLYPGEKVNKAYSEILKDIKEFRLEKTMKMRNYENELVSLNTINKGLAEDIKKKSAEADYYKEKSELLEEGLEGAKRTSDLWKERSYKWEEELKKANELADSWKRDYERLRDKFIYPIYNILYPDKMDLNINVTDLLNDVKNLKVYSEENGTMYKEIQEWREKCIARGDEISKLQNIMTEKDVEIKRLKKDNVYLNQNNALADVIFEKNTKLIQTISDQEITIKALLITIKEMCKEDETNE